MKRIRIAAALFTLFLAIPLTSCGGYVDEEATDSGSQTTSAVKPDVKRYSVSYYNYDSTFLYACEVYEGGNAVYKGPDPVKPATEEYKYTFYGWSESEKNIRSNKTLYARYTSSYIPLYSVTFKNYDDTTLYETAVRAGKTAIYGGETPTREASGGHEYQFVGWNKSLDNINEHTTVVAQYSVLGLGLQVKFLNYDDSLLDIQYTDYGFGVTYQGNTPEKPAEGPDAYAFSGWDVSLSYITEDTVAHAQYVRQDRYCKVEFRNYDDTVLYTANVKYGNGASYPYVSPSRRSEGPYQYAFTGWDKDTSTVYKDMLVYAQYRQEQRGLSSGFSYGLLNDTDAVINSYSGNENDVYVPSTLTYNSKTYNIVKINQSAFANNQYIKKLYIDENVTTIGTSAFDQCSNLKEIVLPNSLEKIDSYAFSGTALTEVTLRNNCSSVGRNAFPSNIKSISISPQNHYLKFEDRILYNYEKTIIYTSFGVSGDLVIPNGVEKIGSYAFYGAYLNSVTIPSSVKTIDTYAFYNSSLATVVINNATCSIATYAFSNCYSLGIVSLGSSVVSIGDYAFSSTPLVNVTLPSTLVSFSSNAFSNCSNLKSFIGESSNTFFPVRNGVVYTQSYSSIHIIPLAFSGTLYIPSSVTSMNFSSLYNSYPGITDVNIDSSNPTYFSYEKSIYNKAAMELIYVPYSVKYLNLYSETKSIADSVCYSRTDLRNVTFNSKLQYIGTNAFYDCYDTTFDNAFPSTLKTIGDSAFYYCSNLFSINIGNSCTSIGTYAFYYSGVSSAQFGSSLVTIKSSAFNSSALKSVTLPSSLTSLGSSAFSNCASLTQVNTGNGLTSLPDQCFYNCSSLSSVTLSNKLTSIGSNCFYNTYNLRSITFPSTLQTISSYAFRASGLQSVSLSNTAVNSLGVYCFGDCLSLTTVTFSSNLTTITNSCFYGCSNLTSVALTSKITTIGSSAFSMTSLNSITIPAKVTMIDQYAFSSSSLQSLRIESTSLTISGYAFNGCSSLKDISVGSGSVTFSTNSFSGSSSNFSRYDRIDASNATAYFKQYSFRYSYVSLLILGGNLKTLENTSFSSITHLVLPTNVQSYVNRSFATSISNLYYLGTKSSYDSSYGGNNKINNVGKVYYYSSSKPTDTTNKYWRYVNNFPTVWEI